MSDVIARLDRALWQGISPAMPDKQGSLLQSASDVIYDENSIQPIPGQRVLFPKLANDPILGLNTQRQGGEDTIYWGTASGLYKWSMANGAELVTGSFTGGINDRWSIEAWGEWTVATNNVDPPVIDKNDTNGFLAISGGIPSRIKKFVKYKAFMIGLNYTGDPNGSIWCNEDDIEDWVSTPENFAGSLPHRDMSSEIITGLALGDGVIVYGENDCQIIKFIGAPDVLGTFPLLRGIGAVGLDSVCRVKNLHYGLSANGFWQSDGVDFRYIDSPAVKDVIQLALSEGDCSDALAWHLPNQQAVVFYFPDDGSGVNNRGLAYCYTNESWWDVSYGRSAVTESDVFPNPMAATYDGYVVEQPIEHTASGQTGEPLELQAAATLGYGFGDFGFGEGPFGGEETIDG